MEMGFATYFAAVLPTCAARACGNAVDTLEKMRSSISQAAVMSPLISSGGDELSGPTMEITEGLLPEKNN